jgi:hypothetical protein
VSLRYRVRISPVARMNIIQICKNAVPTAQETLRLQVTPALRVEREGSTARSSGVVLAAAVWESDAL